jgi:hypothetical protein
VMAMGVLPDLNGQLVTSGDGHWLRRDRTPRGDACYMINCTHPTAFTPDLAEGAGTARLCGILPDAVAMETLDLCKLGHQEDGGPV